MSGGGTVFVSSPDLQQLLSFIATHCPEYSNVRALEDGTVVGTVDLMFTRAVVIDINHFGWGRRYCYSDKKLATLACISLQTGDDEPLLGFIAQRPERPA